MERIISVWNICDASQHPTDLVLEKVLSEYNHFLPEGFIELLFSTSQLCDIKLIQQTCSNSLFLSGNAEQVLTDIDVSDIVFHNGRYYLTLSARYEGV